MESISNKLKKYGWALVLTLFTLTSWGQVNNLKYQVAKHPDQVPKVVRQGSTNQLTIRPAAKALLERVALISDSESQVNSAYSPFFIVETDGYEEAYCFSFGQKWDNWINKVTLNNLVQASGNNLGYGNYTDVSATLEKEHIYDLVIEPSYDTAPDSTAYYSAWIDFNQDNDFDDSGEQVMQVVHDNGRVLQAKITIPSTAKLDSTRMRISVNKNQAPNPCDTGEFSEVEDYTIIIEGIAIPLTLDASPSDMSLPSESGMTTIAVTTNTTWTAQTYDSWIQLSPMEGATDGTITISYESNPMSIGRVAIITIRGEGGVESKKITIIQDGATNTSTPPTPSRQITYVNQLATGENTGDSWKDAYTSLQTALITTTEGEIWVAAGTYLPTTSTNTRISFELKPNVSLYGGFSTNGNPAWEDRAWERYATILSGDIGIVNDTTDNTGHVLKLRTSITFDNTVDGFTITEGHESFAGGGAYISSESNTASVFTFRNCLFKHNSATFRGGAISSEEPNLNVENCQFEENYSIFNGGALSFSNEDTLNLASLEVLNCTFNNNHSIFDGGAITASGFTKVVGSWFSRNSSGEGGALNFINEDTLNITSLEVLNCTFNKNESNFEGGAISASGFTQVAGSLFSRNSSHFEGGAITYSEGEALHITNCTFAFNSAYNGSAIVSPDDAPISATIINSAFYKNEEDFFFINNNPFGFSGEQDDVNIAHSFIDDTNCPSNMDCGEGMIFDSFSPFVDAASDDFRPMETGPLVNNGNNELLIPNLSFDLAGNPRIIGDSIDIGAYEAVLSEGIAAFPTTAISRNTAITYTATLFPNPTSQYATIQLQKAADTDISGIISNRDGQIIQRFVIPQGQITQHIDLMDYPTGVYWAKLKLEHVAMPAMKLIVVE